MPSPYALFSTLVGFLDCLLRGLHPLGPPWPICGLFLVADSRALSPCFVAHSFLRLCPVFLLPKPRHATPSSRFRASLHSNTSLI